MSWKESTHHPINWAVQTKGDEESDTYLFHTSDGTYIFEGVRTVSINWAEVSDHYCWESCRHLQARARPLAGQCILTPAHDAIELHFLIVNNGISHACFGNRLTEASAFGLLHLIHHVDRDACFRHFTLFPPLNDALTPTFNIDANVRLITL